MKKITIVLFFLLLHSYFCTAQQGDDRKIEAIRVAFITRELNLSPQEAQQFWPVYNNYLGEVKKAIADNPNDVVVAEERVVEIRKKYKSDFKRILSSDDRVNKTFTMEKSLRDMFKSELENRRNKRINPR